ncbi:hypothetical protein [Nannocystis pusilla]|uniref:magnesium chelatase subunit ChlI family protein n=1 Tax=Nannocystis pusilla TaxID=889268 RepID=UPI003B7EC3DF
MLRYQQRVSGPLLDRIDVSVSVTPARPDELRSADPPESSALVRTRVTRARARQLVRLRGTPWRTNAEVPAAAGSIERLCALAPAAERLLAATAEHRGWSPRAQHRLRRVARTIADLADDDRCPRAPRPRSTWPRRSTCARCRRPDELSARTCASAMSHATWPKSSSTSCQALPMARTLRPSSNRMAHFLASSTSSTTPLPNFGCDTGSPAAKVSRIE